MLLACQPSIFSIFNPVMSDDLMNVKLDIVENHVMKAVFEEL